MTLDSISGFSNGNDVRGKTSGARETQSTTLDGGIFFTNWTPDPGFTDVEVVEELASGTPTGTEGTLTSKYQTMYLDDIIITTKIAAGADNSPDATDAGGNPFIGATRTVSDFD